MTDIALLDAAIRAVCPIDGVAIGDPADQATWRIDYAADATEPQKSAAESALAAFDPDAVEQTLLSQDLIAQFTADDAAKIQAAVSANVTFWLLWQALTAQRDPMAVASARFRQGWAALVKVLGQSRMSAVAAALGLTI